MKFGESANGRPWACWSVGVLEDSSLKIKGGAGMCDAPWLQSSEVLSINCGLVAGQPQSSWWDDAAAGLGVIGLEAEMLVEFGGLADGIGRARRGFGMKSYAPVLSLKRVTTKAGIRCGLMHRPYRRRMRDRPHCRVHSSTFELGPLRLGQQVVNALVELFALASSSCRRQ